MKLVYGACVHPDPEQPGYFAVTVPDLPGCVSGGASLAEAIEMAVDAASGWVLTELEDGNEVPEASPISDIKPDEPDGFVTALILDMDTYTEKFGKKAVRKNVTIPAWMNTFAEKNHVNFSSVLQKALEQQLHIK